MEYADNKVTIVQVVRPGEWEIVNYSETVLWPVALSSLPKERSLSYDVQLLCVVFSPLPSIALRI